MSDTQQEKMSKRIVKKIHTFIVSLFIVAVGVAATKGQSLEFRLRHPLQIY